MEQWKDVVGYEGLYQVSSHGRVKTLLGRFPTKEILKQTLSGGYPTVGLYKNKKRTNGFVYRLVARAFLGPVPEGMQIAHLDGNKLNSNASNFQYVSPLENMRHKILHGTQTAKLKKSEVIAIKQNKFRLKIRELAEKYNVSTRTICSIKSGQYWGWLNV